MSRKAKMNIAAAVVMAGSLAFLIILTQATVYNPEQEITPPANLARAATNTLVMSNEYPSRIIIPEIAVDAPIQDRGLVTGDRMSSPTNFTSVGWYEYSTIPGQIGTAVLYAHLDNGLGLNGVFKNLDQLSIGDEIDIITIGGTSERFSVNDIETYSYQDMPFAALGEVPNGSSADIALITCAGDPTYDPVEGYTYDHRLVVYATRTP